MPATNQYVGVFPGSHRPHFAFVAAEGSLVFSLEIENVDFAIGETDGCEFGGGV